MRRLQIPLQPRVYSHVRQSYFMGLRGEETLKQNTRWCHESSIRLNLSSRLKTHPLVGEPVKEGESGLGGVVDTEDEKSMSVFVITSESNEGRSKTR